MGAEEGRSTTGSSNKLTGLKTRRNLEERGPFGSSRKEEQDSKDALGVSITLPATSVQTIATPNVWFS